MPYTSDPNVKTAGALPPNSPLAQQIAQTLMARTRGASPSTQNAANFAANIPIDYEGVLRVYAERFGRQAAQALWQQLPTMSPEQLKQLQTQITGLGSQDDMMRDMLKSGAGGPR